MADEFNLLLRFLQANNFRIVMVDGPRGTGKSTLVDRLLHHTDMVYYKTWGKDQKEDRLKYEELGLDLPQGTFFILDYLRQIVPKQTILADRGNLSGLAYQRDRFYSVNLQRHYADLMLGSRAALLLLDAPLEVVVERRRERAEQDEQRLDKLHCDHAAKIVQADLNDYQEAIELMLRVKLRERLAVDLGGGVSCYCFVHKDLETVE